MLGDHVELEAVDERNRTASTTSVLHDNRGGAAAIQCEIGDGKRRVVVRGVARRDAYSATISCEIDILAGIS